MKIRTNYINLILFSIYTIINFRNNQEKKNTESIYYFSITNSQSYIEND